MPAPPTTLGASTGARLSSVAVRRPPWRLIGGVAGVAAVGALVAALVVSGGGTPHPAPTVSPDAATSPPPVPATTALAIVTDPSGALVTVDGVAQGAAPVNVAVPVGADVLVRAELGGYQATSQHLRVGAEPSTLRLELAAVVVDAGVLDAPGPRDDGSRSHVRPHPPRGGHDGRAGRVETGSGSAGGTGSGTADVPHPFNPSDVP
jgi:hypothetical protein